MSRLLPLYAGRDAAPRPAAREQVHEVLCSGDDPVSVAERVAAVLDEIWARWLTLDVEGEAKPACVRGCSHCCHERVELTAPEVFLIARYLHAQPDPARDARIEANARALESMSGREHHLAQLPCALLAEDGSCSVYPARPLACRRAHATDASVCASLHADPELDVRIPAAPSLQWSLSSLVLGWLEGCAHAGRAPHHYELHAGLLLAMRAGAEARFRAGDDPLRAAMTLSADELPRVLGRPE